MAEMSDLTKEAEKVEGEDVNSSGENGVDTSLNISENTDRDETEDMVVTLDQVIAEEKELIENADEVLAGSDDKNCSYPEVRPDF